MLSNAFSIGVSGVKTAQTVTDMISHNIANIDTPGYKRLDNHNYEVNFSGPDNKPFMPAGVDTKIASNDYPWLDNRIANAREAAAMADALKDGIDTIEKITSDSTLSESFTKFMNASQDMMANQGDPVLKEAWNLAGEEFTTNLNRIDKAFEDASADIMSKLDFNQIQLETIQKQIQSLAGRPNTEDVVAEMNFLKQQLAQTTGTIAGYNKVLNSIIPPVTGMYNTAKQEVIQGANTTYGQELISDGYAWNRPSTMGDIVALTEFGSQKFNKDMGKISTVVGSMQSVAGTDGLFATNGLEAANKEYDAAYGVDMTDQATKLLQYQRIYEANTKVIQAADNMIGTLLDIFN